MPFSPGQSLGHYKILTKLGEGGMGEVYEARDESLGRSIALKVLSAESAGRRSRLDRFRTEAKAVAALNHPNIVHIYSVEEADGIHFLTMEKVEGEALNERTPEGGMEIEDFLAMATPLASAVAAAHSAGVTHRDLKPANILIDSEGLPKVLDFGLAKMEPRADRADTEDEHTVMMTREGTVLGSAPYMSPEQARGETIDARSDVFSLGTVLYEALTGISPFRRRSPVESQMAVIRDQPDALLGLRPDLPPSLASIVEKAMAKDPDRRYQLSADLYRDLKALDREVRLANSTDTVGGGGPPGILRQRLTRVRLSSVRGWVWATILVGAIALGWMGWGWINAPAEASHQSLAVLPFDNLTGSAASDYLGTGIAVHLITRLSELSDLRVIGRSEAWDQGEEAKSRQELARRLGVDLFLEGGVQRDDDGNLNVSVQLTDARRNATVWGETFVETQDRLMDLQSEIARWVTGVLQVSLSRGERRRLNQDPTRSFKAYNYYLQGQDFLTNRQLRRGAELADQVFRQAIREDPEFALAYVGLSEALWRRFRSGDGSRYLDRAEAEVAAALELDPDLAAAQVARARILRERGEVGRSIAELQRAVADHPKPAEAYIELGYSYRRVGELKAAEESFRAATVLDAEDWRNWNHLGSILTDQGQLSEAEGAYQAARNVGGENNMWPLSNLVAVRVLRGKFQEAIDTVTSTPDEITDSSLASNLGTAHYYLGQYEETEPLYRRAVELEPDDPTYLGNLGDLLAVLGRNEEALQAYQRAIPLAEARAQATEDTYYQLQVSLYNAKASHCPTAIDHASDVTPIKAEEGYAMALVTALCGSDQQAVDAAQRAIQLGYPAELIATDQEFAHLRGIPEFDRLADAR